MDELDSPDWVPADTPSIDHGEVCSYRVDRIGGVRPASMPFTPRCVVEF